MLLVDCTHQGCRRRKNLVNEDEYGLFRRELDPLPNHVDELPNGEIGGYQILLLVDRRYICSVGLLADYWNTIRVLLSNTLGLCLTLLKWMLILELGTHVGIDLRVGGGRDL